MRVQYTRDCISGQHEPGICLNMRYRHELYNDYLSKTCIQARQLENQSINNSTIRPQANKALRKIRQ